MHDVVQDRLVVVTGGANGIGRALGSGVVARGAASVIVADVSGGEAEAAADALGREGRATVVPWEVDVTDADAVAKMASDVVDQFGTPGLVCANAGVGPETSTVLDVPMSEARWVVDVNVLGVLATVQAFGRPMRDSPEQGHLLVTASEHSLGVPHAGIGIYTASKHALLGLCDVMRRELPAHLGVSLLCPGLTSTELWRAQSKRPDSYGGPTGGNDLGRAVLGRGMEAGVVAERALAGVERGDFLIPTHYNAKAYADSRSDEVTAGFDRLAQVDTSEWHVEEAIAQVFAGLESTE